MLDLLINLVFMLAYIFFLLALFASAIYEVILTSIKARKKLLQESLENFLPDDYWKNELWPKIVESPFMQVLMRNKPGESNSFPSYVPAKSFALAFVDAVRQMEQNLQNSDNPVENSAKNFVQSLRQNLPKKEEELISNIEKQFDERMQRLSGWFKRKYQPILFGIGLLISVALNVDTIYITKHFWRYPDELTTAIDSIEADIEKANSIFQSFAQKDAIENNSAIQDTTIAEIKKQISTMEKQLEAFKAVNAPIGWENINLEKDQYEGRCFFFYFFKAIGWLLTSIAILLGAPFWFDVFNKVTNLRGAGKKPLDLLDKFNKKKE